MNLNITVYAVPVTAEAMWVDEVTEQVQGLAQNTVVPKQG